MCRYIRILGCNMSTGLQVELVGWRERRGSVQSSIITRTTHYDASQGGFVTEVAIAIISIAISAIVDTFYK